MAPFLHLAWGFWRANSTLPAGGVCPELRSKRDAVLSAVLGDAVLGTWKRVQRDVEIHLFVGEPMSWSKPEIKVVGFLE
jgi:hypothetical protein